MQRAASLMRRGGADSAWRTTLAGLCGTLVGIGLARFAYTPLIPALIDARWFSAAEAAYLGAANLAGYLAGALLARRMARYAPVAAVLRAMMALAAAAFFACALPLSFSWFFVWRFASGVSGGTLMVLGASIVLATVPPSRRGLAGGIMFTGVGLGIAASGTLVPFLLRFGLVAAWCGLGALALALTALAWRNWPGEIKEPDTSTRTGPSRLLHAGPVLWALFAGYGLNAVGLVPHMVFLVDFVARGLGHGIDAGAQYWVLFGLGAMAGPVLAGQLADRIGFAAALKIAFVVQAAAVGSLALTDGTAGLIVSSLIVGASVPGIVPLALGRVHELMPGDLEGQRAAWSVATTAFALGQAGAAYGFSFLFARTSDHVVLFGLGVVALLAALAIDLAVNAFTRPRPPSPS